MGYSHCITLYLVDTGGVNPCEDPSPEQDNVACRDRSNSSDTISFLLLNTGPMNMEKAALLSEHIVDCAVDVVFMTETHIKDEAILLSKEVCPFEFHFDGLSKKSQKFNIGIVSHKAINVRHTVEHMDVNDVLNVEWMVAEIGDLPFCLIQQPPGIAINEYLEETVKILTPLMDLKRNVLVVLKSNSHKGVYPCDLSAKITRLLESVCSSQHMQCEDHTKTTGWFLALLYSSGTENRLLKNVHHQKHLLHKHTSISFNLSMHTYPSPSFIFRGTPVESGVDSCPWQPPEINYMRRLRKAGDVRYERTGLEIDKHIQIHNINIITRSIVNEKIRYKQQSLHKCELAQRFSFIDKITQCNKKVRKTAIKRSPGRKTPADFANYFIEKIARINEKVQELLKMRVNRKMTTAFTHFGTTPGNSGVLNLFTEVTATDVSRVASKCKKQLLAESTPDSGNDVCPDSLKEFVNQSLISGEFPTELQKFTIKPVLKQGAFDKGSFANYRPVSSPNLKCKVLEKLVAKQVCNHMELNNIREVNQSANKENHSAEMTLLKIHDDMSKALDDSDVVLFVKLDITAAFDLVDHNILLRLLEEKFGITGTCLTWFKSYLTQRKFTVQVGKEESGTFQVTKGVVQGSVLGPILFDMYMSPLEDIFREYNDVKYYRYVDDIVIYSVCAESRLAEALLKLNNCLNDVSLWLLNQNMYLNATKVTFTIFKDKYSKQRCEGQIEIFTDFLTDQTDCVKILGTQLDAQLTMKLQVDEICRSTYTQLRQIGIARKYLGYDHLVCYVKNKMRICSLEDVSLLGSASTKDVSRLQNMQDQVVRMVCRAPKYTSTQSLIDSLGWLSVASQIEYNMMINVYKILHGLCPSYLTPLLTRFVTDQSASCSLSVPAHDSLLLVETMSKTETGQRAFSRKAPGLWNKLPFHLRHSPSLNAFKKNLKKELLNRTRNGKI